jgi:N-acetylglucosaminyldiphosphoundecaprenol N-acetyl-beta-D-mannosaminyltransferase
MTKNHKKTDKTNLLFGLDFFGRGRYELLDLLGNQVENSSKLSYIVTPNPEQVIQSRSDRQFLRNLQAADLIVPDGMGIIWASQLLAIKSQQPALPERIGGVDLALDLLELAREKKLTTLVIGGRDYSPEVGGVGQPQPLDLQPDLYWLAGYQNIANPQPSEEKQVTAAIKKLKPDLVFVAFGAPYQEEWAVAHRQLCQQSGVKILMVVGGAFDYILGRVPRAPKWLQRLGGEWIFRLVSQPWRWRRQLRLISYIKLVLVELIFVTRVHAE